MPCSTPGLPWLSVAAWSPAVGAAAARLDADQFDAGVVDERVEHAGRVAAAADAGDDHVGQPADLLEALRPRLAADDRLEVADHHRERVRPDDAADDVVRVATLAIQSRMASLMASRSVRLPVRDAGRPRCPSPAS